MFESADAGIAWRLIGACCALAMLLGLLAFGLRAARGVCTRTPVRIERRGGCALGSGAALHVLRIGGVTLVVGSSASGVALLCRLGEHEIEGPAPPTA
jgi:hypothetical protein